MDIRRRHIIIALVIFVLFALMLKPEILSKIFILVFMGIVPGTDITLPWWVTMLGFVIALAIGIAWLLHEPVYSPVTTIHDKSRRHTARKRVLKQTSSRKNSATSRYKKHPAKA